MDNKNKTDGSMSIFCMLVSMWEKEQEEVKTNKDVYVRKLLLDLDLIKHITRGGRTEASDGPQVAQGPEVWDGWDKP